MYRRVLLSAVTSVALVSSAFAADIYMPPAPYAAVALPPSWAGFYLGVNGGYGGNGGLGFSEDVFRPTPFTTPAFTEPRTYSTLLGTDTIAGGFGGGQVGYNFQFGSWVVGAEADLQGSNIMGSGAQSIFNPIGFSATPPFVTGGTAGPAGVCRSTHFFPGGLPLGDCAGKSELDVDWFGTVRGRLGYAFGNTLIYGTGGFAAGGVRTSYSYTDNAILFNGTAPFLHTPQHAVVSNSATNTGWVAGAGIEVKLSPNWSLKGEYQYIDLGTISGGPGQTSFGTGASAATPCATAGDTRCRNLTGSSDVAFNTVRVGLNYYFNAPPPPLPLK